MKYTKDTKLPSMKRIAAYIEWLGFPTSQWQLLSEHHAYRNNKPTLVYYAQNAVHKKKLWNYIKGPHHSPESQASVRNITPVMIAIRAHVLAGRTDLVELTPNETLSVLELDWDTAELAQWDWKVEE